MSFIPTQWSINRNDNSYGNATISFYDAPEPHFKWMNSNDGRGVTKTLDEAKEAVMFAAKINKVGYGEWYESRFENVENRMRITVSAQGVYNLSHPGFTAHTNHFASLGDVVAYFNELKALVEKYTMKAP
jgi:hypothetical protein